MAEARAAVLAPGSPHAPLAWLRANLYSGWLNALVTVAIGYALWKGLSAFIDWAFLNAIWSAPDSKACRAAAGTGACWAFVAEKHRFILFGTYPYDEQWRPAVACVLLVALWIASAVRALWKWWLSVVWLGGLTLIAALMWGGVFGLPYVENQRWGGLVLTLLLTTFGIALAFPLSVLVALGRRSSMPVVRGLCVGFIELVRGVPLISLLFMASVMLPLFLPEGVAIDKLVRAQIALVLFAAAYLAEVVRGGLQAIPAGQYEAADALGLSYWRKTLLVILPQALQVSIPPLVNSVLAFFKDTSLVLIIGLFDLLGSIQAANSDTNWLGFSTEGYVFAACVYWVFCFGMSRYSQQLERKLHTGHKR